MKGSKLKDILLSIMVGAAGVAGLHFLSKVLDSPNIKQEEILQNNRAAQLNRLETKVDGLNTRMGDFCSKIDNNQTISSEDGSTITDKISAFNKLKEQLEGVVNNTSLNEEQKSKAVETLEKMANDYEVIGKIVEKITTGGNDGQKLVSNFVDIFYAYLDSLTLLQESAFIHILIYIIILFSIYNILAVLFGNEIIKYFDLENKYPKLNIFFKLRAKFQRYYLLWHISCLFVICLFGIFLDLLVFY